MKRPDVLDKNLRGLLRRSYVPVRPAAEYRAELKAKALSRFSLDRSPPVDPVVPARPDPPTPVLTWLTRAAAAILLLGASAVLFTSDDSRPRTRDALLADGLVALRDASVGDWFAADSDRTRLPRGGFLQVATPGSVAHAIDVDPRGRLAVASASEIEVSTDPQQSDLRAWLTAGAVVATPVDGTPWIVESNGGVVRIEDGVARFEDADVDTSLVEVIEGSVTWLGDDGSTRALTAVSRWRLVRGELPTPAGAPDDVVTAAPVTPEKEIALADPPPPVVATDGDAEDEPVAPLPPSLIGSVRDARTGLAVPRFEAAAVAITHGDQPAYGQEPVIRSFAADGGTFSYSDLTPGTYKVFVTADGYATWRSPLVIVPPAGPDAEPAAVAAELVRGATVEGRVVDAITGAPISGAFVFSQTDAPALLVPIDTDHLEGPLAPAGRTAETDVDGRFRLTSLAPGAQTLRAGKRGFAPSWADVPDLVAGESRGRIDLSLASGGGVRGHVVLQEDAPLASVPIIAMPMDSRSTEHGRPFGLAVTDEAGAYSIGDLPPGMYVLVLLATLEPEDLGDVRTVQPCRVAANAWQTVDFGARVGGTRFSGRVTDSSGEPVVGQMLTLSRTGAVVMDEEHWISSTTDDDGRFEFSDVEPGPHVLYFNDAAGGRLQVVATVDVPDVPTYAQDLVLSSGVVAGRVVDDETGEPLRFSLVMLVPDDGRNDDSIAGKVATDAAGRFRFGFVAAGPYRLRAIPGAPALGTVDVGVHVDTDRVQDGVELRARPGASIKVRVTDGDGAPVRGAAVRLFGPTGRPFATAWNPITDGAGRRRLTQLPPGTWTVGVARGAAPLVTTVVVVGAGDEVDVEIELNDTEPNDTEAPPRNKGG